MDDVTYVGDVTFSSYVTFMVDATYATFYDCFELNTVPVLPLTYGKIFGGSLIWFPSILGHAQENRVRTLKT